MPTFICTTCGVAHAPSPTPPARCAICAEERQYENPAGQAWITSADLHQSHLNDIRELEPDLLGIGTTPQLAIGQRALFVAAPGGGVLWDCTALCSDQAVAEINARGGLRAIAISHPHFYAHMAEWSARFGDVPIYLHADDQAFVMNPVPAIAHWSGETCTLGDGLTLVRCGGHFQGSTVLHWSGGAGGKGALMTGDTIMVVPDTNWLSFMYSYPNLIPLGVGAIERIEAALAPFAFERIYGGWWDRVLQTDGKARLRASAARYLAAIRN